MAFSQDFLPIEIVFIFHSAIFEGVMNSVAPLALIVWLYAIWPPI
jgi:hypothetical protein